MKLSSAELSDIIALAWADDVPFSAIKQQYNLTESEVIAIMRSQLKISSFKLWRKRVNGRRSKQIDGLS